MSYPACDDPPEYDREADLEEQDFEPVDSLLPYFGPCDNEWERL